ncbi:MAG: hypothetical protein WAZ18_02820 [Alphaproteobacteria bacterium]
MGPISSNILSMLPEDVLQALQGRLAWEVEVLLPAIAHAFAIRGCVYYEDQVYKDCKKAVDVYSSVEDLPSYVCRPIPGMCTTVLTPYPNPQRPNGLKYPEHIQKRAEHFVPRQAWYYVVDVSCRSTPFVALMGIMM